MRTIATAAARLNARSRRPDLPALLAMRDRDRLPDPRPLLPAFPRGAALVWRGGDPDAAAPARAACRRLRIPFLWAGSATDARALGADGLHLRDDAAFRASELRAWRRHGGGTVTAAAHDFRSLRGAVALGVDAVLLSPVFPTRSHPGGRAVGITRFRSWVRACPLPVYALGGITPRAVRGLLSTDCAGIAGIDWVVSISIK